MLRDWIGGYVVYMLQLEVVLHFPLQLVKNFSPSLSGHVLQIATLCRALGHCFYFLVQDVRYFPLRTLYTNVHLAPDYWYGLLNGM